MSLDITQLNAVDFSIMLLVVASSAWGVIRGIVKESISLFGWIVAIVIARLYAPVLADYLIAMSALQSSFALGVAGLSIIIVVKLVFALVALVCRRWLAALGLSVVDRILGAFFGFVRGSLVTLVVLMLVKGVDPVAHHELWKQSQLIPYILVYDSWFASLMGEFES